MKQMKTPMLIIENAGGILRNISSQISSSSELRRMLRENHCYEILLEHLKSSSLTVVSNACGTLWNLSGGSDCEEDQRKLLDLNAIPMLKSLVYSKHDRISQGASAALRNLLSSRFAKDHTLHLDSRLTAQIYSPNHHIQEVEQGQKSPGSDTEFDLDFNSQQQQQPAHEVDEIHHSQQQQHSHLQLVQEEPPVAHQQSSSAAASFFQQRSAFSSPHNKPLPMQFHNYPSFPPSGNQTYRHTLRPSTITYTSVDYEPLDLTVNSAKSSPIHVISAAEFGVLGNRSMPHSQRGGGGPGSGNASGRNSIGGRFYRPQSQNQSHAFLNSPNLIHHTEGETSGRKYSFPGAKFNQSCPEILSRFQQSNTMPAHNQVIPDCAKPLDYSSNSGSTASSTRGAGEAAGTGLSSDSTAGNGDSTCNYSLRFSEFEADEVPANRHHTNNATSTNVTKSEDTMKTYYCEGTPHNFSMSNSCQDLVQELEYEKAASNAAVSNTNKTNGGESQATEDETVKNSNTKLQPIDEVPKAYYVENTPAVFSRTSSLSSISSSVGLNAGENKADYCETFNSQPGLNEKSPKRPTTLQRSLELPPMAQVAPQPMPRRKLIPILPQPAPRVTFSAEETPLMFSRCSSVASLDSLDVGVGLTGSGTGTAPKNDDELSDYSRRASEVVSPSDLPDSPRGLAPPIRIYEQSTTPPSKPYNGNIQNRKMDEHRVNKSADEDAIKVFTLEERSGLNSCRSLSPLTVDGEELPVIGKGKLDSISKVELRTDASECKTTGITPVSILKRDRPQESSFPEAHTENETEPKMDCVQVSIKPRKGYHDDEMKVFAMEGTPFYGVSNATSLSDLMADIDEPSGPPMALAMAAPDIVTVKQDKTKLTSDDSPIRPSHTSDSNPAVNGETALKNEKLVEEEPIYSDAQLLEKCIRVGKAIGIPKSQSEFRIESSSNSKVFSKTDSPSTANIMSQSLQEGSPKKGDSDDDDADLAALIMIGRNRAKDKEKIASKGAKLVKKADKEIGNTENNKQPTIAEKTPDITENGAQSNRSQVTEPSVVHITKQESTDESDKVLSDLSKGSTNSGGTTHSDNQGGTSHSSSKGNASSLNPKLIHSINDPNIASTMSLGSEWNDDAPTLSSPIPSMSISTALRLAGSVGGDSSMSKPPQLSRPPQTAKKQNLLQQSTNNMNASSISMSFQHELLDNIDPPSNFSNLVSSSDCFIPQSPPQNQKSQNSTLSDRVNKKWKALTDPGNQSSAHSNLSAQKPPPDFDLENSMMSVASIKSEIYEMSTSSINNEIFESAVEDLGDESGNNPRLSMGDHSLGLTFTIFPPENANRLSGVKSTDLSDGGNTVVSEDFTDAEDIEDFETAPADDEHIDDHNASKPEKTDLEKEIKRASANVNGGVNSAIAGDIASGSNVNPSIASNFTEGSVPVPAASDSETKFPPVVQPVAPMQQKPLMEVHPLDTSAKYNTYVVRRSPMSSPKSSPRQKRRDDPERYRTRTINPLGNRPSGGSSTGSSDANGNPDLKFATFRVSGPKILKNINSSALESESSVSPESTPGNSPKGIRGRRKPLYSSLPPSSIVRKGKSTAPPVPPKPVSGRASSPARSTASSTSVGRSGEVYVRPTRTTELRIAANNSRDSSPRRGDANSSKNSSNSSLNAIHHHIPSRYSDTGLSTASAPPARPKVAPKPPIRTTPSIASTSSDRAAGVPRGFNGSSSNVQIKVSNSSFGFGQQAKIADSGFTSNMKGYSTLPKSSKLGRDAQKGPSGSREKLGYRGDSRESVSGSEKSSKSGIGKITNLFKKMDFRGHGHNKESSSSLPIPIQPQPLQVTAKVDHNSEKPSTKSTGSKFSNLFGRNRSKDKSHSKQQLLQPQPFREPVPLPNSTIKTSIPSFEDHSDTFLPHDTSSGTTCGVWVRRDGDNKVIVPPFNYTPPGGNKKQESGCEKDTQENGNITVQPMLSAAPAVVPVGDSEDVLGQGQTNISTNNAPGSAKITTV
jgi:hypothetical protein